MALQTPYIYAFRLTARETFLKISMALLESVAIYRIASYLSICICGKIRATRILVYIITRILISAADQEGHDWSRNSSNDFQCNPVTLLSH